MFNWSSSPPPSAFPRFFGISSPTTTSPTVSNNVSESSYQKAKDAIKQNNIQELGKMKQDLIIIINNLMQGETLLMTAVRHSSHEIIELLASVPNVDFKIKDGESLLEVAIKHNRINTATLLMTKYNVVNQISHSHLMKYLYSKLLNNRLNNSEFIIDSSSGMLSYTGNQSIPQEIACQFFNYSSSYKSILESIIIESNMDHKSVMDILKQKSVIGFACWEQYVVKTFAELMANSCPQVNRKPIQIQELQNPVIVREPKTVLTGGSKSTLKIVKLNEITVVEKVSSTVEHEELKIFKKINNYEGVVKLLYHYIDEVSDMTYLYLELMDSSLDKCFTNLTNFGENNFGILIQILFICLKCCETMEYLHEQKIIHYDIKPANILINMIEIDGLKLVKDVKICDFDASASVDRIETITETFKGTLQYVSCIKAPELLEKISLLEPTITKPEIYLKTAFDVYSFGVTMFELFSGRHVKNNERLVKHKNLERHVAFFSIDDLLQKYPCLTNEQASILVEIGHDCIELDLKLRPSFEMLQQKFLKVTANIMRNYANQQIV